MKSTIVFASLFATLTLAGPVKRSVVTKTEYQTLTVTVIGTAHGTHHGPGPHHPTGAPKHDPKPPKVQTPVQSSVRHSVQPSVQPSVRSSITTSKTMALSASPPTNSPGNFAGYNALSDYARPILDQHNIHRSNHSAPPLVWDNDLVNIAKQIAETCVYAHSRAFGDGNYGQNIAAGAPPFDVPKTITNGMYNGEINAYPGYGGEPDMSKFEVWGHFSQIVWMNTSSVGCYTNKCASLANVGSNVAPYFTVCNYRPSGNYGGQYGKNVLAPLGEKAVIL